MNKINLIINGEEIPFEVVQQETERMRPHYDRMVRERNHQSSDDELYTWAKENVVESTLLQQEATKRYITEEPKEGEQPKDPTQLIGKLIEEECKDVAKPSEKEMKDTYEEHKTLFISPEQVHASHIVKHVKDPSEKAGAFVVVSEAKKALDGGESFESVSAKMSDCPSNSGDLGVFPRGQMVQEFEDIVFAMNPGEVSDIFFTDFGYHIAKLHKKVPSEALQFETVKDVIMQQMINERKQMKLNTYVDELRKKAVIKGDQSNA